MEEADRGNAGAFLSAPFDKLKMLHIEFLFVVYMVRMLFTRNKEKPMIAVKGIYQGGDTVKLDISSVPVHEPYEVVVEFLNPLQYFEESGENAEGKQIRRQKAFERFRQYRGILPADFDYKKELA